MILQCGIPIARIGMPLWDSLMTESLDTAFSMWSTILALAADNLVTLLIAEMMDDLAMDMCNKYSGTNYTVAPSLFLEFHGSEKGVEDQVEKASKSTSSANDFSV